jgi:phosphomannomutase
MSNSEASLVQFFRLLEDARTAGKISASAAGNVQAWLEQPRYAEYAPNVAQHITAGKWQELDDAFWTVVPFGTAGRRGRMYPIGCNAINDRTIGESAQGLADYVRRQPSVSSSDRLACAIAYDTRHNSRLFAELCAEVMAANGFHVHFFDGFRATPELSFAVRALKCACGIMVSASHNPPSDNAVKMFWSTGGQLKPPHDLGVIERVMRVETIARVPFTDAVREGRITFCQEAMDSGYRAAVLRQGFTGPRQLKILYSPLHGVGLTSVLPILQMDGFKDIEVFAPHAEPSGDFPNVPGNIANPENSAVFAAPIERAKQIRADVILASDPDADRLGVAAPLSFSLGGEWEALNGNQIAVLLAEYLLNRRQTTGTLSSLHYIIKTIVTTDMLARQAEAYGIRYYGEVLTGFKWIGGLIDEIGPEGFIFGAEEAHGYLAGAHCRDKDGAVAAMLMAELAAACKVEGRTLHQELDRLYGKYGKHLEKQVAITLPGADGMARINAMMERLRTNPPRRLVGVVVTKVHDYLNRTDDGPISDVLVFETEEPGFYAAVRPSGTEPKIKFYLFGRDVSESQLDQLGSDLIAAANAAAC